MLHICCFVRLAKTGLSAPGGGVILYTSMGEIEASNVTHGEHLCFYDIIMILWYYHDNFMILLWYYYDTFAISWCSFLCFLLAMAEKCRDGKWCLGLHEECCIREQPRSLKEHLALFQVELYWNHAPKTCAWTARMPSSVLLVGSHTAFALEGLLGPNSLIYQNLKEVRFIFSCRRYELPWTRQTELLCRKPIKTRGDQRPSARDSARYERASDPRTTLCSTE